MIRRTEPMICQKLSPIISIVSMKKILIIIFISFTHMLCHAYGIKVDTVVVDNKDSQTEQLIVTINNPEDDTLWIWFDKNSVVNEARYIKRYFLKRQCEECFSIFEIATDPNMDGCWWKVATPIHFFIKCLMPKHEFTIVFFKEKKKGDSIKERDGNLLELIKIYGQKVITQYCKGIDTPYGIKRISYPYDTIVYPVELRDL